MPKNELDFIVKTFEMREEDIYIEGLNEYDRFVDGLNEPIQE